MSVAPAGTVTPARPTPPVAAFSPTSESVAVTPEARWIAPAFVTAEASTTALESVTAQLAAMATVAFVSVPESSKGPSPESVRPPRTVSKVQPSPTTSPTSVPFTKKPTEPGA